MGKEITPSVGILVFKGNKVLLVRHGEKASHLTGSYGLPAGRFRPGETDRQAAARELEEETGYRTLESQLFELPKIWFAVLPRKEGPKKFSYKIFVCNSWKGKIKGEKGKTTPQWIPTTELGKYNLIVNVKEIILEGLKHKPQKTRHRN